MDFQLTDRQRDFATEKHYVVEDFLNSQGLSKDEYYDVVIFGFLRAVSAVDVQNKDFMDFAYSHMQIEVKKYQKQKHNDKNLSLDYPISRNSNLTYADIIADKRDRCDEICEKLSRKHKNYRLLHISQPVKFVHQVAA